MVHGKNEGRQAGPGRTAHRSYQGLSPAGVEAPKAAAATGGQNLLEMLRGVFAAFSRDELDAAVKAEKNFRKYAQKLSEKYHVHMKESRIAKLRAAHRAHEINEDAYHRELKALMKTRPGDLDILEEIHFA